MAAIVVLGADKICGRSYAMVTAVFFSVVVRVGWMTNAVSGQSSYPLNVARFFHLEKIFHDLKH